MSKPHLPPEIMQMIIHHLIDNLITNEWSQPDIVNTKPETFAHISRAFGTEYCLQPLEDGLVRLTKEIDAIHKLPINVRLPFAPPCEGEETPYEELESLKMKERMLQTAEGRVSLALWAFEDLGMISGEVLATGGAARRQKRSRRKLS